MSWRRRIARYALGHEPALAGLGVLMLVEVGLHLLAPWPLKVLIDNGISNEPLPAGLGWIGQLPAANTASGLVGWMAAATVLILMASRFVMGLKAYVETSAGEAMTYDLAEDLFDHVQHMSLQQWKRHPTGDLIARINTDAACVRQLMIGVLMAAAASVVTLAGMFLIMWTLSRPLAWLAVFVALPLGFLLRVFHRPMTRRALEQANLEGSLLAHSERTLVALPDVQAFTREEHEDRQFHQISERTIVAGLRLQAIELLYGASTAVVSALGTAGIILLGGLTVLDGGLTVGDLVVFLAYLAALYGPLEGLAQLASQYAEAAAHADRVLEVLDIDGGVQDPDKPRRLPKNGGSVHVRFEGVWFGFEPKEPVLEDINLEVRRGETIALVGRTGAGKTTLVSLIPRFFDPWEGRVTLEGIDVRDLRVNEVRSQVGFVRQEPILLPISVAENIAYGRPGAALAEIKDAAEVANADEFIGRLPNGYDTVLGERGADLSGGQRQRLAIARALLKNAPILILDEPTSALDAETEMLLLEAVERLMTGRTTFVIAHRLSTVRQADRIVVIDNGAIIEIGTHDQLLTNRGLYHHLHQLQIINQHEPLSAAASPIKGQP